MWWCGVHVENQERVDSLFDKNTGIHYYVIPTTPHSRKMDQITCSICHKPLSANSVSFSGQEKLLLDFVRIEGHTLKEHYLSSRYKKMNISNKHVKKEVYCFSLQFLIATF
jgi:hypothetical protein